MTSASNGISEALTLDLKLYFLKIDEMRIFSSISANLKNTNRLRITINIVVFLLLPDAVPRPRRERNVSKRTSFLRIFGQKSVRIESVRVGVDLGVPMKDEFYEDHIRTGRNVLTMDDKVLPQLPGDDGDTLVQSDRQTLTSVLCHSVPPEDLLQTELDVLHVADVTGGRPSLAVSAKDGVHLLLAPGLDVRVSGQQVEGEGHVGGRGVVTLEHEGVHLLPDVLVSQDTSVLRTE